MAAVLPASSSTEPQHGLCTHNSVGSTWLPREEPRGRRNSIPPAQAPTARHMLAYLPRPPTDTSRYGTFPQKVGPRPHGRAALHGGTEHLEGGLVLTGAFPLTA